MKTAILLCLTLLFKVTLAIADVDICSRYVENDQKMRTAIEFLRAEEGNHQLGTCRIELHVCTKYSEADDAGDMIGDILVTDAESRQFYVPLYFFQVQSDRLSNKIQNGRIMFHYDYSDHLPNAETYGVESIHLEILTDEKSHELQSLDLGFYLRKDFIDKDHRYRYQWTNCYAKAD